MKGGITLDKIRIKNVRSLQDTGLISLPPITLLVGENSSGKSTFLRTFPLIKQSICKRTEGPILWAGDVDDYVDFGSFAETVTNNGAKTMTFEFQFPFALSTGNDSEYRYYLREELPNPPMFNEPLDISYALTIAQNNDRDYVSELQVQLKGTKFCFRFSPAGDTQIMVDNISLDVRTWKAIKENPYRHYGWESVKSIFGFSIPALPSLYEIILEDFIRTHQDKLPTNEEDLFFSSSWRISMQYIGECLCCGFSLEDIFQLKYLKRKQTRKSKSKQLSFFIDIPETVDNQSVAITRVRQITNWIMHFSPEQQNFYIAQVKLLYFLVCFSRIDRYLETYFRQIHYIAPLRATAERYYRLRNLAIDEVDYQGKNLGIYLSGLSQTRLKSFQNWTYQHFGFQIDVPKIGGHLSVKVRRQEKDIAINLSDTGFGYSQILPIITQLWDLATRPRIRKSEVIPLVIAIEQPELHLHPALQAKLTDAFIASIKLAQESGYSLQLLLETHSDTIVTRFGRAIAKGKINKDDVSVVVFNKSLDFNRTEVIISNYDQDGYLLNWPVGFFAPEE